MKWVVALVVTGVGLPAWAGEASPCAAVYRTEYLNFARTNDLRHKDAAEIYAIYFDYANDLLGFQPAEQKKITSAIYRRMLNNSLCTKSGQTKSISQVVSEIRTELDL